MKLSLSHLSKLLTLVGLSVIPFSTSAQDEPAFWEEVREIILKDVSTPSPRNEILFIGSSSFRLWKNMQECFPSKKVINNAFGGSTLNDQIQYFDYIIAPYSPRQVVIYCGENDIAYSNGTLTATDMENRVKALIQKIRKQYPKTFITFISLKPSPSRREYQSLFKESNDLIRKYLSTVKQTSFVDVYSSMLTEAGKPRPELFQEDQLHMNEKGYDLWRQLISPHLK